MSALIPDHQEFLQDWRQLLDQLPPRDREIVELTSSNTVSLTDIGRQQGVSRERIRQRKVRSVQRILSMIETKPEAPIRHAIHTLVDLSQRAGLQITNKALNKDSRNRGALTLTEKLTNLGVADSNDHPLIAIMTALAHTPKPAPPDLRNLIHAINQILRASPRSTTPENLAAAIPAHWKPFLSLWPRLELDLHIQANTGFSPDPTTGAYPPYFPITHQPLDPTFILTYTTKVLHEAQQPMTVAEIADQATCAARQDGQERTYTTNSIRRTLEESPLTKWAGSSTYALTEWDTGLSNPEWKLGRRAQIGDEIAHFIAEQGQPMTMKAITDHIQSRLNVMPLSAYGSIIRNANVHFRILPDGTVDLTDRHK